MLFCVDANIFLTAWYTTYPPSIFKPLWDKLSDKSGHIEIIRPVYNEIEPLSSNHKNKPVDFLRKNYPVRTWIDVSGFNITDVDEEVNNLSIQLEMKYQITAESKGAGQVDITLIAYSKINLRTVVTLEAQQPNRPGNISKYKIPLICKDEGVKCINFVDLLSALGVSI